MEYLAIENNFKIHKYSRSVLKQGKLDVKSPLISIVIPTYKRPDTLKEALESALNQQKFDDYEVIVLDNDKDENIEMEKLIASYSDTRLFYYKNEENLGMVGNWNRGIELARGEWINLLHDDDFLHPYFLTNIMEAVNKENENVEYISCEVKSGNSADLQKFKIKCNDENNNIIKLEDIKPEFFMLCNSCLFPAIIFKKSVAEAIGGFNEKAYPIADYTFWIQMSLRGKSFKMNKILGFYRVSDFSGTSQLQKGFFKYDFKLREELYDLLKSKKKSYQYSNYYYLGLIEQIRSVYRQFKFPNHTIDEIEDFFEVELKYKKKFLDNIILLKLYRLWLRMIDKIIR